MNQKRPLLKNHGFTLLEALVTGAIAMVVILGFLSLNTMMARQQKSSQIKMNASDFNKKLESIVSEATEKILKENP